MPFLTRLFAVTCLLVSLVFVPLGAEAKSKKPIRLIEGVTIEQQVVTAIAARALRKAGFKYELVAGSDAEALSALLDTGAHVHLSMPATEQLGDALGNSRVLSLGGLADNDPSAAVLKIVGKGMKKKWPYAQKLLKRMILSDQDLAVPVAQAKDGTPIKDAAANWFKANPKIWKPWIAASKNWMKP